MNDMNKRIGQVLVNNVPNLASGYVVARLSNNALWYWGSWKDEADAEECARNVEGVVVRKV